MCSFLFLNSSLSSTVNKSENFGDLQEVLLLHLWFLAGEETAAVAGGGRGHGRDTFSVFGYYLYHLFFRQYEQM